MRRIFAKIHLWLSIPLGILVSVICLTGAALVFEQEITRALDPQLYRVSPPVGVQPLPPSQLAERIREQMPDSLKLSALQLPGDPLETCMASFKGAGRRMLSVNPYTGDVNGWTKSPAFFQTMRKLHRWLMDAPAAKGQKSVGKMVVGVTTLLLVVILVSGLVIWIPRTRKALKHRLKVSCNKGWAALLVRQPCDAGILCRSFPAGDGPDRAYLVVRLVSQGRLFALRWRNAADCGCTRSGERKFGTRSARRTWRQGRGN